MAYHPCKVEENDGLGPKEGRQFGLSTNIYFGLPYLEYYGQTKTKGYLRIGQFRIFEPCSKEQSLSFQTTIKFKCTKDHSTNFS